MDAGAGAVPGMVTAVVAAGGVAPVADTTRADSVYVVPGARPPTVAAPADTGAVAVAPPGLAVTCTVASCHGHVGSGLHWAVAVPLPTTALMAVGDVTVSQIQSRAALTLAYTPGYRGSPQEYPQLVTPTSTRRPLRSTANGPPESPWQVSLA